MKNKKLLICILSLALFGCNNQATNEITSSTDDKLINEEIIITKDSIKPLSLTKEQAKLYDLLTNNDTNLYEFEVDDAENKKLKLAYYLLINDKWEKKDLFFADHLETKHFGLQIINPQKIDLTKSNLYSLSYFEFDDDFKQTLKIDAPLEYAGFINNRLSQEMWLDHDQDISEGEEIIIYSKYGTTKQDLSVNQADLQTILNDEASRTYEAGIIITIQVGTDITLDDLEDLGM
ncbi:MAG: hypothetical protein MR210_06320 [Erysipelotrichaceae bacterium]|nr:hypothetical protein [Erysipelotrichaceae bacterium]MDY5251865.1 hypothetical protein [Erysipelotrichaceae bacterium]